MHCILLIGIHTYYCNDQEQDFSPLMLLFNHKTPCAITEKIKHRNNQTCATVITTGMPNEYNKHNATLHYVHHWEIHKINASYCSCTM